jgi:uncharacterized membrane protein
MRSRLMEKPEAEEMPLSETVGVVTNGRYAPPPADEDGKRWVRTSALVQVEADELYAMWRDLRRVPMWQEQIESVTETGEATSHWVMKSGDKTIEWDSEVLADEPGKRIAWRSIDGESNNAGEVVFERASGGCGTLVTVLQEFKMGALASAWETIVGRNPKQAIIENLRHFKALAETGEIPRIAGQPHGPRGTVGDAKKALYGEKVATPSGTERKAS